MAPSKPIKEPLEALEAMTNEVLVQMGKALKVANRDGQKGAGQYTQNLEQRLSISNRVFHVALDEIESEIIAAKAVLLRDLAALRTKAPEIAQSTRLPLMQQQQKQAPTASMGIDHPFPKTSLANTISNYPPSGMGIAGSSSNSFLSKKENKPAAPFPDMGMNMPGTDPANTISLNLMESSSECTIASPKLRNTLKPTSSPAKPLGQMMKNGGSSVRTAPMGIGTPTETANMATGVPVTTATESEVIDSSAVPVSSVSTAIPISSASTARPPAAAAPAPMGLLPGMPSVTLSKKPPASGTAESEPNLEQPQTSTILDSFYNSGTNLDTDMGGSATDTNNFDDMYFGGNDTSIRDSNDSMTQANYDNVYFGL